MTSFFDLSRLLPKIIFPNEDMILGCWLMTSSFPLKCYHLPTQTHDFLFIIHDWLKSLLFSFQVILYTMYLTFNTLIAEPDSYCNPLGAIILQYDTYTGVSGQTIFGCMVTLSLLVFAFTVRTDTSYLGEMIDCYSIKNLF